MVISYPATWHRRRNIAIPSSADKIYVTIGSNSDADAEDPPLATVLQANIDGTSERPDLVACTKTPDVLFEAHLAALDIQFYIGKQFPDRYRNGA
jgi:glucose/arabinose dehydrogenase